MTRLTPEILAECLDQVIEGRVPLEECLTRYPGLSAELQPLLETARAGAALPDVALPSTVRRRMRSTLLTNIARSAESNRRTWLPGWLTLASGDRARAIRPVLLAGALAFLTLFAGIGVVAAAKDALPGDDLYPLKTLVEHVEAGLSTSEDARSDFYLRLTETRLQEVEKARQLGRVDAATVAAEEAVQDLEQSREHLGQIRDHTDTVTALQQRLAAVRDRTRMLALGAPGPVRNALTRAEQVAGQDPDASLPSSLANGSATHPPTTTPTVRQASNAPSNDHADANARPAEIEAAIDQLLTDLNDLNSHGVLASADRSELEGKLRSARLEVDRGQFAAALDGPDAFIEKINGLARTGHLDSETYLVLYQHYASAAHHLGATFVPPIGVNVSETATPARPVNQAAHPASPPAGINGSSSHPTPPAGPPASPATGKGKHGD